MPYEHIPTSVVPHFLVAPAPQLQPSSVVPSQLSSTPLHISVFPGYEDGFLSLQSKLHDVTPSPSSSYPSSTTPSQLLSTLSHSSFAPGYVALDSSLQSFPPQERDRTPSLSISETMQILSVGYISTCPTRKYVKTDRENIPSVARMPSD